MSRRPVASIIPSAMVNTMAANTERGRYASGPVRASNTSSTMPANTSWASWLRAPARSAMAVCVGLALTTNAPLTAAAAFRHREPQNIRVLVDPLAVLQREYARRRGALGDDHHEAGAG